MPMPVEVDRSLYEVRRYFFKPEDWAKDVRTLPGTLR